MKKYEVSLLSREGHEVHHFDKDIPLSLFFERIPNLLAQQNVSELSIHISVSQEES